MKSTNPVVVYGASGHAKVVLDILHCQGLYEIIAVLDEYKADGFACGDWRVAGKLDLLPGLAAKHPGLKVIVAVGDNWQRANLTAEIHGLCPGMRFATGIHPSAQVARGVSIGEGAVVMAGAVINPAAFVGEGCIVNTRASLDHDSSMAPFASLGPGVAVGGGVRIGSCSNIGIGASVIHEISIGAHTLVGAGAVVVHHIPDCVVAYGVPARVIRKRQPGDRYLREIPTAAVMGTER
ncbi:MAG: NeuD/PglB/VioB family sugar acetyltransferase [Acidobacteria bacterium]|nr:NeuD/PglB/VioB family sugar acetyltransferase [Acidobacteriota bacterium]